MESIPAWVAPTIAISLVIIAASLLAVGAVALFIGFGLRKRTREVSARLSALTADAKTVAARLRHEIDGYADLSTEARAKLKRGMTAVETRLQDLDALAEVVQEEVQETALSAASLLRTVRRSGRVLGAARRAVRRRPPSEGTG
jgi:Tfp pilus assembly protein FimT